MPVPFSEKTRMITALQSVRWDLQQLEWYLWGQNNPDGTADDVWAAGQRLDTEIDILIGKAMDEWTEATSDLVVKLKVLNDDLTSKTKAIKSASEVLDNVARAVRVVDQVLQVAAKAIAA